jgi:hypothetical protein
MGIIAGKLKGAITRKYAVRLAVEYAVKACVTFIRLSPIIMLGAPQATSTGSFTFRRSPCASSQFFPFSRHNIIYQLVHCAFSRSRNGTTPLRAWNRVYWTMPERSLRSLNRGFPSWTCSKAFSQLPRRTRIVYVHIPLAALSTNLRFMNGFRYPCFHSSFS